MGRPKGVPFQRKIQYEDGIPVDRSDWDYDDWRILHFGLEAIKASIRERHKIKMQANGEGIEHGYIREKSS